MCAFVALGACLPFLRHSGLRRRAVNALILYVLALHAFVAATQTDGWPFSAYRLMAADATVHDDRRSMLAFRAVGGDGREWDVDPMAWSPLYPQAVTGWFVLHFRQATEAQKREAMGFLLEKAETARRDRVAGLRVGNERLLGPLAAPDINLYRPAAAVAPEPLAALRLYEVFWTPTELALDASAVERRQVYEYRPR